MSSTFSVTCVLFLLLDFSYSDLCKKCDCYPENKPLQVFCENDRSQNLTINDTDITTKSEREELQLMYIYGYNSVEFATNSLAQLKVPVTIFILHCSQVIVNENALRLIHSLTIANTEDLIFERNAIHSMENTVSIKFTNVKINTLPFHSLYDISPLYILEMKNVSIKHIENEAIVISQGTTLKLQNCVVEKTDSGAISFTGSQALLKNNLFIFISNGGISLYTENKISVTNNLFHNYSKSALNLQCPNTEISSNYFTTLPAGALARIHSNDSIDFTNNIIEYIDLGGVILDMDYRHINFLNNTIDCDCSPKKTSILIPKDIFPTVPYLLKQFDHIFYNNYCHTNCTISLKDLSQLLLHRHICNNSTENKLTDEELCNITFMNQEHSTISNKIIFHVANASEHTYMHYKVVLFVLVITYAIRNIIT